MKNQEFLKQVLRYLKVARKTDCITYHALMDGDRFHKEVIKPLEEICHWDKEDEEIVEELTEKLKKETEGKTLKEKSKKLKKILKIGGLAAGVVSFGIGAIYLSHKNRKEKRNAED